MRRLRVASFNIQHGLMPSGRVDTLATAQACATLGADVLALQEVDKLRTRSGRADQATVVAGVCGMARVFGRAHGRFPHGEYGNALLTRGRLSDIESVRLPCRRGAEPRSALLATADIDGAVLSVAVTHLALRPAESEPQLLEALAALSNRPRPWLLLGDLNRGPELVAPLVTRFGLALVETTLPTFPVGEPRARIDHVAFAGMEPRSVEVRALPVSDHRALIADLLLPD